MNKQTQEQLQKIVEKKQKNGQGGFFSGNGKDGASKSYNSAHGKSTQKTHRIKQG